MEKWVLRKDGPSSRTPPLSGTLGPPSADPFGSEVDACRSREDGLTRSGQALAYGLSAASRRSGARAVSAVLELRGVGKRYPGDPPVDSLRSVSLRIEEGELLAIV